ncbi:phasin family protein [Methylocystis parvus]|uniref:Phasin domain-containing protein n=1 Tax=Methylocystis parvus TaxID=134 RepID=A0A6B8M2Q0_9HYPH|nr:phasin family protein [Methylocystis parvus]QGM96638.1 hypothetical protein F7D14_03475 [Methylocystis parvus]WBJ99505.1 phasin family protein [Methylocystis parvus OBBP]
MATKSTGGSPSNSVDAQQDIPAEAPAETTPAVDVPVAPVVAAEIAAPEPVGVDAAAEPVAEIVDIVSAPLALVEKAVESATEGFAASFSFDSSQWSKKSLDLWAENAAAFFDLAEQVSKAQSLEEIVDLQSRFAKERVEAFIRQSKELMDFAKSVAAFTASPLCAAGKAA